uniref:GTPase IMAP family member 8 n=1 Tax=Stegastes partitus TaxID=144197 RepID=A0A3B5AVP1_9TELE
LRVVLLGRTGTGRSSSGNTILGRSAFCVDTSPCSVTTRCMRQTGTADGRSVSVVDTPGFFHTHLSPQEVMAEVGQCIGLSSLGPHVFLVTLQPGRFTQEEREALEWIKARFGPDVTRFMMVLFTWGDQLQSEHVENFLEKSQELSEFVSSCRGGYHTFDNSEGGAVTRPREEEEGGGAATEGGRGGQEASREAFLVRAGDGSGEGRCRGGGHRGEGQREGESREEGEGGGEGSSSGSIAALHHLGCKSSGRSHEGGKGVVQTQENFPAL